MLSCATFFDSVASFITVETFLVELKGLVWLVELLWWCGVKEQVGVLHFRECLNLSCAVAAFAYWEEPYPLILPYSVYFFLHQQLPTVLAHIQGLMVQEMDSILPFHIVI
jgi:hypothetical protein